MDSPKDKYRDECLNKLQNEDWEQITNDHQSHVPVRARAEWYRGHLMDLS